MLLIIIKRYWKEIIGVFLLLSLSIGSYFAGRSSVKPTAQIQTVTQIVEKTDNIAKKTQQTDKITTKVTKPDGTIIVQTEDKDTDSQSTEQKTEKDKTKTTSVFVPNKAWRIGLMADYKPSLQSLADLSKPSFTYEATASHRLTGDLWADFGYNWLNKTAAFGLSVEF